MPTFRRLGALARRNQAEVRRLYPYPLTPFLLTLLAATLRAPGQASKEADGTPNGGVALDGMVFDPGTAET